MGDEVSGKKHSNRDFIGNASLDSDHRLKGEPEIT